MSVLIKGMEMPTREPLLLKINPDGTVSTTVKNGFKKYAAIPVPPHGRLIDADALLNNKGVGTQIAGWGKMFHETVIEYAPTIIPADLADKEGEG